MALPRQTLGQLLSFSEPQAHHQPLEFVCEFANITWVNLSAGFLPSIIAQKISYYVY